MNHYINAGINITPANFYNDQVNFYDVTRVGGVKSHMMKEFKVSCTVDIFARLYISHQ